MVVKLVTWGVMWERANSIVRRMRRETWNELIGVVFSQTFL